MRLSDGGRYMLELWLKARDDTGMPHVHASYFMRDPQISDKISLQFKAPDGTFRYAYAGPVIKEALGFDPAGMEIDELFKETDKDERLAMAHAKFAEPLVIHGVSAYTTLEGELFQLEVLQVPYINNATSELVYVMGSFQTTLPDDSPKLDGLTTQMVLFRTAYTLKTLEPVDTDYTYPPPNKGITGDTAERHAQHA